MLENLQTNDWQRLRIRVADLLAARERSQVLVVHRRHGRTL
jgi:hypothetical protein